METVETTRTMAVGQTEAEQKTEEEKSAGSGTEGSGQTGNGEAETWLRYPQTAAWFDAQFRAFADQNPLIAEMEERFLTTAGVDIRIIIDHWTLPPCEALTDQLTAIGMLETPVISGDLVWRHPQARFPTIRIKASKSTPAMALAVEDIDCFALANGLAYAAVHGDPDSAYRCSHYMLPHGELMAIVRNGYDGYTPETLNASVREKLDCARTSLRNRDRSGEQDSGRQSGRASAEKDVLARTQSLVEHVVADLGRDRATDEFFAAEREYYLTRNAAARWQYDRQQSIGIGWANHDHHTYRCSRSSFRALMHLWQTLGFVARERFYAGAEAGWGAQIVEHPVSRVVIFADVDMAPEELNIDFATTDLAPRSSLGTIGLWCALHGSSIASAGMHHLECEFDHVRARASMEAAGFRVMKPFTEQPMLWQAFTEAEVWQVAPERVHSLRESGAVTPEQAERFLTQGAAGSHVEILQRWDGYKGFNKTGVSNIIRDTDARQ